MRRIFSYFSLLTCLVGMPAAAGAVVIDDFTPNGFFSNMSTGMAINSPTATAGAIGGSRQVALNNAGFPGGGGAFAEFQPIALTELQIQMGNAGTTFYSMYNGGTPTNPSATLTGLNSPLGANITLGGATGLLLRNLANGAANTTVGITLFSGGVGRTVYYSIATATTKDYFFSFVNWSGMDLTKISGIILSIAAPGGGGNDVNFFEAGAGNASFETVAAPTANAVIITPEPASLVMWSGMMFVGLAFFGLRRRSAAGAAPALAV